MPFKGLQNSLKGLLFEDVPEASAPAAPGTPAPAPVAQPVAAPSASSVAEDFTEIDHGLQAKLLEAMNGAKATLYNDLDDFIDTMADAIPDENLRWKKGIEFLLKKGSTIPLILTDVDKCIGVLEEHNRLFSKNVEEQLKTRVGSKMQSVETLTAQLAAKEQALAALQAEMTALRSRRDADQAAISTEQTKVDRVQRRFAVVYPRVLNEVKAHRVKVESFVPAATK